MEEESAKEVLEVVIPRRMLSSIAELFFVGKATLSINIINR